MSKTRRMVLMAMLTALSTLLLYPPLQFILVPAVDFMKVEFSILPVLVGVFVLGLGEGFIILLARSVLWVILFNQGPSTWIGVPMNIAAVGIFMTCIWVMVRKKFSYKTYVFGSILAILAAVLIEIILNLFYAVPLYAAFANFDIRTMFPGGVEAYVLAGVIPFNTIEMLIFAFAFAIIFELLRKNKAVKFYNIK